MQEHTLLSEHATTMALDQHARSVTLAALAPRARRDESRAALRLPVLGFDCRLGQVGDRAAEVRLRIWAVRFRLAREIRAMGIDFDIIAVTSIPRSTEDKRLKGDRIQIHPES
ncbi:MAG: hypothetical protein IKG22_02870 [Atopobiaceae bacterium]|nr:hypothetical protein [Atopobiaceae bacterium]